MSEEPPDQPASPATPPEPTPPASPADPTTVNPAPPAQPGLISAAPVGWGAPTPPPAGPVGWVDPAAPPAAAPPPGSPGATVGWEPVAPQREVAPGLSYADTISRLIAYVIDLILIGIVAGIIAAILGAGESFSSTQFGRFEGGYRLSGPGYTIPVVVLSLAYFVFFWSGGRRATIGQRIFGIQVGNAFDGHPLSIEQALRRWVGLGLFLALLDLVLPRSSWLGLVQLVWWIVLLGSTALSPTQAGPPRQVRQLGARPAVRVGIARAGARLRAHRRPVPALRDPGHRGADPARLAGQRHPVADRRLHLGGARVGTLGRVTEPRPDDPPPPTGDMDARRVPRGGARRRRRDGRLPRDVETRAVFPAIEPGSLRPLFPARRARGPGAARRDPRRLPAPHRAERHALAAPGLPGLLRDDRVGARDPRRDADGGPRPEPDAVADLADRHRARGGRRRLAAPGARAAGRLRRPADRHGLDVVADRAGGGARGGRPRRRGTRAWPGAPDAARAAGLRLGRGAQLDREGVHDPRARARRAGPDPDERALRAATRRAARGDRRRPRRRAAADRDRRHDRDDVVDVGRPGRRHRRHRRARGPVAARRRRLRRARSRCSPSAARRSPAGSAPIRSSSTRTSGCSRRSTRRCC